MGDDHVRLVHGEGVSRITLSHPERRNALSLAMIRSLLEAIARLPAESGVVIVDAEGPVFSAGHDLSEMVGREGTFYDELFDACSNLMLALHRLPQPVIAQVQGPATAAGCQLVAACDLAIASEAAWFATPGVKVGLFCSTPMVPLTRVIGRRRALRMLFTGEPVDAQTALDWGLVNDVVAAERLAGAVDELAATVLGFSRHVIGLGKHAFYGQIDRDEETAYRASQEVMACNAADADAQEGFAAFLAKRDPVWKLG